MPQKRRRLLRMASYKRSTRPEFAFEKDTFRVNKRPVPDGDVVAIVAPECRLQRRSFTNPFEQLRQQNTPFIAGIHRGCIKPYKYCLGARVARVYREISRDMPKAQERRVSVSSVARVVGLTNQEVAAKED